MKIKAAICCFMLMIIFSFSNTTNVSANNYFGGACGDNANWTLVNDTLTITGTGAMEDYIQSQNGSTNAPWDQVAWDAESVIVEEGITHIGNNSFLSVNYFVKSIKLPNTLTSIGSYAFCGTLKYIDTLVLPNSINNIDSYAFYNGSIKELQLSDSLTVVSEWTFGSCDSLETVYIPKTITSIRDYAFWQCTALKDIYYEGTIEDWLNIDIGYGNTCLLNANVHFPQINVSGITLNTNSKTLFVGNTYQLIATISPENADNKSVVWRSSAPSIASVTNGTVTALSPGTTTITAVTVDGNISASCRISVQKCDHTFDDTCTDTICNICNYVRKVSHDYTEATCKAPKTCIVCGTTNGAETSHKYSNYQYNGDATCFSDGSKTAYCDYDCGETNTISATGTKLSHTYTNYVSNDDARCEVNGTKTAFCEHGCETKDTIEDAGSALSHKYTNYIYNNDAKCGVNGTESAYCDHGCQNIDTRTKIGTAYDHESDVGTVTKKATCTATGTKTYKCTKCSITIKIESIAKIAHDYKAATCTAPKTCKNCGAKSGSALGHKYTKVTTKAAITSRDGYILTECSVCGVDKSKTTIYYPKTVKLSTTSYTYSGSAKKPSVTVKDSKGKTISSKYYTVTYASGRKNVGKYKVTVKFKGNYSGTKTLYFEINPAKTTVKKVTGASKSLKVTVNKKTTQVSGYEIQYSTSKKFTSAKTKTITSAKTTSTTIKSLKAKKTYYVRVRTYKTVNGKKYYSGWSTYKYVKTK